MLVTHFPYFKSKFLKEKLLFLVNKNVMLKIKKLNDLNLGIDVFGFNDWHIYQQSHEFNVLTK